MDKQEIDNININTLTIEVTRRCTMRCAHCMRGEAMDMDIDLRAIDALFNVKNANLNIGNVTFTGGEPSLNVTAIQYFSKLLSESSKVKVESFYVKTNGLEKHSVDLAHALLGLFGIIHSNKLNNNSDMASSLALSIDDFHEEFDGCIAPDIYLGLSFFNQEERDPKYRIGYRNTRPIINLGLAQENGIGVRDPTKTLALQIDYELGSTVSIDTISISANGRVVGDCDYSYERVDSDSDDIYHEGENRAVVRNIIEYGSITTLVEDAVLEYLEKIG